MFRCVWESALHWTIDWPTRVQIIVMTSIYREHWLEIPSHSTISKNANTRITSINSITAAKWMANNWIVCWVTHCKSVCIDTKCTMHTYYTSHQSATQTHTHTYSFLSSLHVKRWEIPFRFRTTKLSILHLKMKLTRRPT